jgi:thioredoxin-dependent peroxiredoxin
MATLNEGDSAPAFALKDQRGKTVSLADFKGRKLLIFFYPKADTPGCTKQACSVRDSGAQFSRQGIAAVGISPDEPGDQARFDEKFSLGFPLLSDPDHRIADAFGVWGEKTSYGKTVMGIIRSSFLVDENGKIAKAWYKVTPEDTVPNALAAVS